MVVQKRGEHRRIRAVRVQFHGIAESMDAFHEARKIRMDSRFASGDANAVEFSRATSEVVEENIFSKMRRLRGDDDEFRIVAVGACEVTTDGEDRGSQSTGIISQG